MANQDLQNRNKILQELLEKKKLLGQQSGTSAPFLPGPKSHELPHFLLFVHTNDISVAGATAGEQLRNLKHRDIQNPRNPNEAHQLALNQRQALEHANAMSWGFFITQDSLHGNLILPVIPRYDPD